MSPWVIAVGVLGAWALTRKREEVTDNPTEPPGLVPLRTAPAFRLRRDAAKAFDAASDDAGETPRITSAWRSTEKQRQLFEAYRAGHGNLAAPPGRSWHEVGLAVDARGSDLWEKAMARHGWKRTVASEPWHWEYRP